MKTLHNQGSRLIKRIGLFTIVPVLVLVSLVTFKLAHAAAITHVQANQLAITTGTTDSVAFTQNTTAGNLIVVNVAWGNSGNVSISDTKGSAYVAATPVTKWNNNAWSSQIFYVKNIAGGADTITATFGTTVTNFGKVTINEYSGLNATNPVDVTSSAVGTASAMNSGMMTTTNASDLIYGAGTSANTITAVGSGFTSRSNVSGNLVEDKTVAALGSYNATATQNGNAWVMNMVAFRPASTDITPPTIPTNVTATAASSTQINLAWTASTDSVGVAGYKVFRNGTQIATTTARTYNNTGLTPSTAYSYTVSAYDSAGNNSALSSSASATTQAPPDTTAPTLPTNVVATAVSPTKVTLTWTASTDNLAVGGYIIYRNGANIGVLGTATTYNDTTVTANTTYTYSLNAYDSSFNQSAITTPVSVTTPSGIDTSAPTTPTNLAASATSSTQINLAWTASTDNVGVTGYKIFRNGTQLTTVTGTTYNNTGLTASTAYSYTVSAYDAAGNNSTQSSSASATTQAPPDTTAPSAPTNVTASLTSQTQAIISWTASTDNVGVTGYKIFRNGAQITTVSGTTFNDTGLTPSTTYSYTISAYDAAANNSVVSATASATTPAAPDTPPPSAIVDLAATTVSSSQINLTWTASTDDVGVAGYQIFRDGMQVGTSATTSYSDTGLIAGSTHTYTATAFDAAGNVSALSNSVSSTTTPPDNAALATWKTAVTNRTVAPAKWVAIGESLTEGQGASTRAKRWLDLTTSQLRTTYPTSGVVGGENYIPAVYRVYAPDSTWAFPWTTSSGTLNQTYWAGDLGYRSLEFTPGSSATYPVTGNSVDIWYMSGPGGGTFTYKVDNGSTISVNSNSSSYRTDTRIQNVSLGSAGTHTITIKGISSPAYLEGFTVYNGDRNAGIQTYDASYSGATIQTYLDDLTAFHQSVAAVSPQLVTIELGGNDYFEQTDPATFKAQMQQLIADLKTLPTVPSIEIIAPYQPYDADSVTYSYQSYVQQLKDIATADSAHVSIIDLSASMPPADTSGTGDYTTDGIHPNNTGQQIVGNLVYQSLTQ